MPSVYFAYRDGALGFACARCDRRCCSGVFAAERASDPGLARLSLFTRATTMSPGLRVVQQVGERCVFLAGDQLCSIHREHGRSAKPLACRLFPAAEIYRLGRIDTLAVLPQAESCPLEIEGAGDLTGLDHASVRADLDAAEAIPAMTSILPPEGWPVDFLSLEVECRDAELSTPDADFIDHAARQLVRAAYFIAGVPSDELASQDVANARADLLVHLALVGKLLGAEPPPALSLRSTRALAAMTGTLRYRALEALADRRHEVAIERVPFVLGVIGWLAAHHVAMRRDIRGEEHELTPTEIAQLWNRHGRLALLLAHLFAVPYVDRADLPPGVPVEASEPLRRLLLAIASDEEARRSFVEAGIPDTLQPRLLKDYLAQLIRDQPDPAPLVRAVADLLPVRFHA
jgi:Fe-S-cluster containining protein